MALDKAVTIVFLEFEVNQVSLRSSRNSPNASKIPGPCNEVFAKSCVNVTQGEVVEVVGVVELLVELLEVLEELEELEVLEELEEKSFKPVRAGHCFGLRRNNNT